MDTIERSLCNTCKYVDSCSLTLDKNFIWSCSEYKLAKDLKQNNYPQKLTNEFKLVSKDTSVIELN
ncbi:hypothetical protein OS188_11810 [Xanthomarina sp. F1114]|uniref:hypothetical protein n=1 Tax=Xanthomarina sp. F1114 TaxID=2996019 RepID=UPI00225DD29E|nr:hypothetical protein [Xanthomarina sp. F1114]MCX7548637.1 hypothetical protein [Xanthomarina sp. F1114]